MSLNMIVTQLVKSGASKGPFTRSDFEDPILESETWKQAFRCSDFKVPRLWQECWKVICSVFTRFDLQNMAGDQIL